MSHRLHDRVCSSYCNHLREQGKRVAWEVGVPGGRIDVVRVDAQGRWVELYELKHRKPAETGIAQLQRYAKLVEGDPLLTLVVTPNALTARVVKETAAAGIRLELFTGVQMRLFEEPFRFDNRFVILPYIHPDSAVRISRKNREWAEARRQELAA